MRLLASLESLLAALTVLGTGSTLPLPLLPNLVDPPSEAKLPKFTDSARGVEGSKNDRPSLREDPW
jgi:hypothetical protein